MASGPGVGVIGMGMIGRVRARSARLAGSLLVGVVGSSEEKRRHLAAEMGAERPFALAEALIADPAVDVVHICTPNDRHVPLAEVAMQAGKHVACEKPLALDPEGAARLAELAAATGRVAAVPFVYRLCPTVREARARVLGAALAGCTWRTAATCRIG